LKQAACTLSILLGLGLSIACGGRSSTSSNPTTSGLKNRALVSNQFAGALAIIDAATDTESARSIGAGNQSAAMTVSSDKKLTLVFVAGNNSIAIVDNAAEAASGSIALPNVTESIAILPDGSTAFAAIRNTGQVAVLDLTNKIIASNIAIPTARRLVLSHNGAKMLAFSDDSDALNVIDTAAKTATSIAGFDRPVWGVFTRDDSKAFILNCGPECGGRTASVTVLDMTSNTLGANVLVSAATIGLLDGSNLYVAGTTAGGGRLDLVDSAALQVTKSGIAISDGFHHTMALASNGKVFIGARTCTGITTGCLSIFNAAAGTAVVDAQKGEVTGIQPISNRNVVYVIEGGELRIYDTATSAEQAKQIDIVGKAFDVKSID